ncbi:MAG: hypothetical protein DI528_11890 [Shinella sp.]|nr:MAG: hypothetical protein DI528_11890 [Shinella sp.]
MTAKFRHLTRTACWVAVFLTGGVLLVKLVFMLVCWIGGHNLFEALFGMTTPIILGTVIGIEAFLWFREWHHSGSGAP